MKRKREKAKPSAGSRYLHGTSPREQRRLALLNDLVNDGSLREIGIQGGEKILEMGSGLGQFARALARKAGKKGRVIGIERSREQIAEALLLAEREGGLGRVEFRQGDALNPPLRPEEWGTFDLAHARFLLEHLPDPLEAVKILVEAVRPGGRIVLEDDDHDVLRLWPDPPGFGELWKAYQRTFDRLGNDPYVGRRLVSLLHQAGASPSRNTWIFFGSCAGKADFPGFVENILRILEGAREPILSQGLLDPDSLDASLSSLESWGKRGDAAFWFAICWAEGIRPS